MKRLTLRIPNETYLYFNEIATKNNMNMNEYFTQLLNENMNEKFLSNSIVDFNHKLNMFGSILESLIKEQNKLSQSNEILMNLILDLLGVTE